MKGMKRLIIGWIAFKIFLLGILWMLAFSGCNPFASTSAQDTRSLKPTPTVDDSVDRETSDPFKGDVTRFERKDRAEKLQIEKVMDLLGIESGSKIGDIGAGSGWFSVIAAARVGSAGRVFAVDISKDAISFIDERIAKEKLANVETVLSREDDPLLAEKDLDAVLILNTYHEIAQPVRFLINLRKGMRPGASLGIIDRDGSGGNHGVAKETVVEEAKRAGFELKEEHDFVKADRMDYFLVFRLPAKKR